MEAPSSPLPVAPSPFPLEKSTDTETPYLQIAHVLFMDIVGYGRLRMSVQGGVQVELQKLVRETREVQQAQARSGGIIIRPICAVAKPLKSLRLFSR